MREELLPYYERELTFIRQMAGEFADKYPKVAGRLMLNAGVSEDPHVERLIEAFALLCGRVHHKLDDEFSEITEALLDALYPHYLRPVPSQAITQFEFESSQSAVARVRVPAGTAVHSTAVHSSSDKSEACSFRTCYNVDVLPLRVKDAAVSLSNRFGTPGPAGDVRAVIRIQLECLGGLGFHQIEADSIRFYLNGEPAAIHALYEMLFLRVVRVSLRAAAHAAGARSGPAPEIVLPPGSIRPVGFDSAETILPYSDHSFPGYRLLQEYFSFPEKFFFFDLCGLGSIARGDFGAAFDILIGLSELDEQHKLTALEQSVDAATFQLGCTPVVNLFERVAEPIRVTQTRSEYQIIPDQHRQSSTEIYSVDEVLSLGAYAGEPRRYEPFYSIRHGAHRDDQKLFWHAHRRASLRRNDPGAEMFLMLVDTDFDPALAAGEVISVRLTCTNREQAGRLKFAGVPGELEPEGVAAVRARCLRNPTAPVRPPARSGLQWRLISHLSLNHLSIVEGGKDALQEILRLYDFSNDLSVRAQIAGLSAVSSRPAVSRVMSETGVVFCRGTETTIEFDEQNYVGGGIFLLSSVLERFLGLYSAVNSFSRLTAATRKGVLKRWPPRTGEQILL